MLCAEVKQDEDVATKSRMEDPSLGWAGRQEERLMMSHLWRCDVHGGKLCDCLGE